jgi:hypothetical protein
LDNTKYGFGVTLNPELKLHRPYEHEYYSASQSGVDVNQVDWLLKHQLQLNKSVKK